MAKKIAIVTYTMKQFEQIADIAGVHDPVIRQEFIQNTFQQTLEHITQIKDDDTIWLEGGMVEIKAFEDETVKLEVDHVDSIIFHYKRD